MRLELNGTSAKNYITWVSLSYAVGFLAVTLHTAKLGFPVIELIKPLYVWIGFPVAIFFLFSILITKFVKKHSKILEEPIRTALNNCRNVENRFFQRILHFGSVIGASIIWLLAWNTLLSYLLIGGFFICLYVWQFYPMIPQQYGGGKSTCVDLIIDAQAVPPSVLGQVDARLNESMVRDAHLLYATEDFFYVRVYGKVVSLKKDAVKGIIWPEAESARPCITEAASK